MVTILKSFIKNYFSKPDHLGLVHRLDQPVVASGEPGHQKLQRVYRSKSERVKRLRYGAICHGRPEPPTGEWQDNIHRHSLRISVKLFAIQRVKEGNPQVLLFEIAHDSQTDLSLLVLICTGTSSSNCVQGARNIPPYADHKYGREKTKEIQVSLRCSLAYGFKHPTRDELILLWDVLPDTNPWLYFQKRKRHCIKISEFSIVSDLYNQVTA